MQPSRRTGHAFMSTMCHAWMGRPAPSSQSSHATKAPPMAQILLDDGSSLTSPRNIQAVLPQLGLQPIPWPQQTHSAKSSAKRSAPNCLHRCTVGRNLGPRCSPCRKPSRAVSLACSPAAAAAAASTRPPGPAPKLGSPPKDRHCGASLPVGSAQRSTRQPLRTERKAAEAAARQATGAATLQSEGPNPAQESTSWGMGMGVRRGSRLKQS